MLVLTRYTDQKIMIGDNIEIMVTDVCLRTGKVRIGIEAPPGIPVHREEVYKAIKKKENGKNGRHP